MASVKSINCQIFQELLHTWKKIMVFESNWKKRHSNESTNMKNKEMREKKHERKMETELAR